jgi:hypothetical protein
MGTGRLRFNRRAPADWCHIGNAAIFVDEDRAKLLFQKQRRLALYQDDIPIVSDYTGSHVD